MKRKTILAGLLLAVAGMQTSFAQLDDSSVMMIVNLQDGKIVKYDVSRLDSVSFEIPEVVHEYVDLELPSATLWATCNIGAKTPDESGYYFAWGETKPKDYYYWNNYEYCIDGYYELLTKYCYDEAYGAGGFRDNKSELLPEDDAATVNWGSSWRMPSLEQMLELYDSENTTSEWTTINGVVGRKFTSNYNSKSIFLPAAGEYDGSGIDQEGTFGCFWTRDLSMEMSCDANQTYISSRGTGDMIEGRYIGMSVRPVRRNLENLKLSETQLNLEIGDRKAVMATFQYVGHGKKQYLSWECSNTDIVEFNGRDDGFFVEALAPGTCTITCRSTDDNSVFAQCQVTVDYGYVDLGLPSGTLWAKYNICGFYPEDDEQFYFPWGMSGYLMNNGWGHYDFFEGTDESDVRVKKYCTNGSQGVDGNWDGLTELLPEDDTATKLWGENWEMPSKSQFLELLDSRYTETVFMQHEHRLYYGYKITSKTNGNSIFLRAAGYHDDWTIKKGEESGMYWLRTLDTNNNLQAEYLLFDESGYAVSQYPRYLGLCVRPVRKQ